MPKKATKTINRCDNCGAEFEEAPRMFPDIPDLAKRLTPGGVVPSAECPECGCLAYPVQVPAGKSKKG